jgi:hypothetical protein
MSVYSNRRHRRIHANGTGLDHAGMKRAEAHRQRADFRDGGSESATRSRNAIPEEVMGDVVAMYHRSNMPPSIAAPPVEARSSRRLQSAVTESEGGERGRNSGGGGKRRRGAALGSRGGGIEGTGDEARTGTSSARRKRKAVSRGIGDKGDSSIAVRRDAQLMSTASNSFHRRIHANGTGLDNGGMKRAEAHRQRVDLRDGGSESATRSRNAIPEEVMGDVVAMYLSMLTEDSN